jgi:hypothetical protein
LFVVVHVAVSFGEDGVVVCLPLDDGDADTRAEHQLLASRDVDHVFGDGTA